jgi:hypothetical protein
MKTKIQSYHTCYVDRENSKPTFLVERKKKLDTIIRSDAWLRRGIVSGNKDRSKHRQSRDS